MNEQRKIEAAREYQHREYDRRDREQRMRCLDQHIADDEAYEKPELKTKTELQIEQDMEAIRQGVARYHDVAPRVPLEKIHQGLGLPPPQRKLSNREEILQLKGHIAWLEGKVNTLLTKKIKTDDYY